MTTLEVEAKPTEFQRFPKIQRVEHTLVTITEKIDGTNAAIRFQETGEMIVQSRSRIITPGKNTDNAGFAGWAYNNREALWVLLGPGIHFGEWWGVGIQRGYDLVERRFSLFNTHRWALVEDEKQAKGVEHALANVHAVPVLAQGQLRDVGPILDWASYELFQNGSKAAGNGHPAEGVMLYLSNVGYLKAPFDARPKGEAS